MPLELLLGSELPDCGERERAVSAEVKRDLACDLVLLQCSERAVNFLNEMNKSVISSGKENMILLWALGLASSAEDINNMGREGR